MRSGFVGRETEISGSSPVLVPARLALCLAGVMALVPLFLASGCGDEEEAQLDSGLEGETVTVEQGFATAAAPILTAADIPLNIGARYEYLANAPGTNVPVSFDLEGPWDLSEGADAVTLVTEYVERADGPLTDELPDADLVARYTWENGTAPTEYIYQSLGDTSWTVYGRADTDGLTLELEGASRLLLFPLEPGNSWQDSYIEVEGDDIRYVDVAATVLAFDEITLPAGAYDAFMIQTEVSVTEADGATVTTIVYSWFAPGVGWVAEVVGLPGEEDRPFNTAASTLRLSDFDDGS